MRWPCGLACGVCVALCCLLRNNAAGRRRPVLRSCGRSFVHPVWPRPFFAGVSCAAPRAAGHFSVTWVGRGALSTVQSAVIGRSPASMAFWSGRPRRRLRFGASSRSSLCVLAGVRVLRLESVRSAWAGVGPALSAEGWRGRRGGVSGGLSPRTAPGFGGGASPPCCRPRFFLLRITPRYRERLPSRCRTALCPAFPIT